MPIYETISASASISYPANMVVPTFEAGAWIAGFVDVSIDSSGWWLNDPTGAHLNGYHPNDRYCVGCSVSVSASIPIVIKPALAFVDPHPGANNVSFDCPSPPNSLRQVFGGYKTYFGAPGTVTITLSTQWWFWEGNLPAPDVDYTDTYTVNYEGQAFVLSLENHSPRVGAQLWTWHRTDGLPGDYAAIGTGSASISGGDISLPNAAPSVLHPQAVFSGTSFTAYIGSDDPQGNGWEGGWCEIGLSCQIMVDASAVDLDGAPIPYQAAIGPQSPFTEGTLPLTYTGPVYYNWQSTYGTVGMGNTGASAQTLLPVAHARDGNGWYGAYENIPAHFPEGAPWSPFSLGRVPTIVVDDFSDSHPVGNRWSGGTYAGGVRTVTGVTSIIRTLKSDFDAIAVDPGAWAIAHTGAGTTDERRAARYMLARKTWYQVKRKVGADSDTCCWANHRWLKITGAGAGTFTLRVHFNTISINDDFSPRPLLPKTDPEYPAGSRVANAFYDVPWAVEVADLTFGAAGSSLYIDLAELAGRVDDTQNHVMRIEFAALDPAATYTFSGISLASGMANATPYSVNEGAASWGYWTGIQYGHDVCLAPVCDGRRCIPPDPYVWPQEYGIGWIEDVRKADKEQGNPRYSDKGVTREALIEDIWAQGEGFTVTSGAASPDVSMGWAAGTYDWAMWLDTGWHAGGGACSASYKFPAGCGVDAPAKITFPAVFHGHSRICGLAWDSTGVLWPARGQTVRLYKGPDLVPATNTSVDPITGGDGRAEVGLFPLGTITTDNNGAWLLTSARPAGATEMEQWIDTPYNSGYQWWPDIWNYRVRGVTVMNAPGSSTPAAGAYFQVQNRGLGYSELRGYVTAALAALGLSLHRMGPGWFVRAYTTAGRVQVERRTYDGGGWTLLGTVAGADPSVTSDINGAVQVAYVSGGNIHLWDLGTGGNIIVATGTKCAHRWNQAWNLKALARWTGGALWVDVSDGQGNVLRSVNVVTAPEQTPGIDWRMDGSMELSYSDGTTVRAKTSVDNGATWP